MLDYSKINSFEAGQRESFEELVCLLAKRERPNGAIQFQRIEGSGGDGGVEALWIFDDVSKCGYQAKFFLKLGSSQWSQLDQSVKRALEVHPELKTYVIALPINLTHKRKFIGLGKSAWEKWESRVKKWSEWANEKDLSVKFEPWTSTDLTEMLYRDENQGLVRHWFGKQVLDTNWFEKNFQTAASLLEERYNPSQHVHISIEEMFDAMVRGPSTMAQIRESYREIAEQKIPSSDLERISDPPVQTEIDYAKQAWQLLLDTEKAFPSNYSEEWGTAAVGEAADAYHEALSPLYAALSNSRDKQKSDDQKNNLDEIARQLSSARSACYRLKSLTDSQKFNAEKARFAIVTGPAGVGKSHLLAHIADQRLSEGAPTILLIGQSFSDVDVWGQIGAILDISHRTSKQILGLLSAAAERQGARGLVMIDAINEGVGANYWRNRISGLLTQIAEYPNLGFVFSCREEYLKFAFPESVLDKACVFHIGGFQSTEEMEAAAETYLDAKGISRPNTPWLSPEFRNPLFLRSTSEALQAKGKVEFPKGLHGISELMSFYLDSLSMRTGVSGVDNALLAAGIKKAVRAIAEKMVETGEDFVELTSAFQIVVAEFAHLALPENTTWLDVLTRTSVLRRDPPPFDPNVNPLNPPQDRIRFAFQRFQDHLMAQAIVDQLEPDRLQDSLKPGGQLQFLLSNGDDDLEFLYVHAGLIGALSTIYPERFGIEFVDTIPKEFDLWSVDHLLQEAFETSCKWRRLDAFSERSLEILNSAEDGWVDRLSLLVEISMTIGHPWNASFLHDYLINQTISERDSYWTDWVNWASDDGGNQIQRLISWANGRAKADTQHLELAALVLSWVLTSSRRSTRDKASKALTSIFLRQSTVFQFVLEKISSCNDPYVIERLFSAAFGACCLDQSPERLSSYSKAMWESCFKGGQPPIALLTRDYALGIIELARANNCLSNDVNLDACLPPFNSAAPDLNLRKEDIERLAKERGAIAILDSASSEWGDFGKYVIPGRVSSFLAASLDEPAPASADDIKELFLEEVVAVEANRKAALEAFEELRRIPRSFFRSLIGGAEDVNDGAQEEIDDAERELQRARKEFEDLLSVGEKDRFANEYLREGRSYSQYDSIDVQQCRLWITKRAYELGWTKNLFPGDDRVSSGLRHGNDFERIGKKYQWIALDEIAARLSDNHWYLNQWPEHPIKFRYTHQNFYRDIEPTILLDSSRFNFESDSSEEWMSEPDVLLPEVAEEDLKSWPFQEDPTQGLDEKLVRIDGEGRKWRVLYEFNCERQDYPESKRISHGARYEEFRFLYCVFVESKDRDDFISELDKSRSLNVSDFNPQEYTDGPFLLEAHWRDTWESENYNEIPRGNVSGCKHLNPVARFYWESHLDKTVPEGYGTYLPQRWLAESLGIIMSESSTRSWTDRRGEELIKVLKPVEQKSAVLIREDTLTEFCEKNELDPVWLLIGERNTWPSSDNNQSCWRRSEGAWWKQKDVWTNLAWNHDTKR